MEGEWGPTDKGSSVVVHPLLLHIAQLGTWELSAQMMEVSRLKRLQLSGHNKILIILKYTAAGRSKSILSSARFGNCDTVVH